MGKFSPKYFAKSLDGFAKEVLPAAVYTKYGAKGLRMMDQRVLEFLDEFRHDVGVPLSVNTPWDGVFDQSGLRSDKHYGSFEKLFWSLSDHTRGAALDIKSSKLTAHELRLKFLEREGYYYEKYGINFIEVGPVERNKVWVDMSWMHVGVRLDTTGSVTYWSPKHGVVSKNKVVDDKL